MAKNLTSLRPMKKQLKKAPFQQTKIQTVVVIPCWRGVAQTQPLRFGRPDQMGPILHSVRVTKRGTVAPNGLLLGVKKMQLKVSLVLIAFHKRLNSLPWLLVPRVVSEDWGPIIGSFHPTDHPQSTFWCDREWTGCVLCSSMCQSRCTTRHCNNENSHGGIGEGLPG